MHVLTYFRMCDTIESWGGSDVFAAVLPPEGEIMENETLLVNDKTRGIIENYVPKEDILDDLVGFFSLFADKTRLRILSALVLSELCVTDISVVLGINQTTVSHQLRLLRSYGAVLCRREGKIVYYSLRESSMGDILLKGLEYLSH